MSIESPYNAEASDMAYRIRCLYDAFEQGADRVDGDLFNDEFSWHPAENNVAMPQAGAGLKAFLTAAFWNSSDWEQCSFQVDNLLAGEKITVQGYYNGIYKPTGKLLSAQMLHIWTVENGKITRFQELTDTQEFYTVVSG